MKKQINNLMIALAFILTIGCLVGCVKQEREKSRQAQTATSSTTKEDKEAIKQKQLAYLKEHEKEIVDFVKAQSPKIESVQIDWYSIVIEESGNGTPQGGGYNLSISGQINQLKNTKFSVDFYLEDQNSIPTIKKMGMLNDIYIEENGGWKIFS
ncbi:MAG: hypothetical protein KH099_06290 [Streptococcus parasanguinis]|nr:hypothetical protein [Streptococcus parasanguinis]